MSTWKYTQNGQTCGPVETSALQTLLNDGTLTPDTLVQREGMGEWSPARTQPEFVSGAPAAGGSPTPSGRPETEPADVEQNKVFALLAYIGPLFLVPLLAVPQSKFARYHTNQGVVLFLAALLTSIASVVIARLPLIGWLGSIASSLIGLCALVFMILGILNAISGKCKPLPLIGQFEVIK